MKLSDFNYQLPKELIAQKPVEPRHNSKLMVLNGANVEHTRFFNFADYLREGDVLVLNDSRVIPARLRGTKETGGKVEALLMKKVEANKWWCLARGKNLSIGSTITFQDSLSGRIEERRDGKYLIDFNYDGNLEDILEEVGEMPTPPYIRRKLNSKDEYQTVYAKHDGSIAAPTAGLHFTEELLKEIEDKGVDIAYLTLHVGLGTFKPVEVEDIEMHRMEAEYFRIDEENAEIIDERRGRLIVVGTTTVRALESASGKTGRIVPKEGWTDLFIYPGYRFKTDIGGLLTNFHLPKSTLLMLVSSFASRERILDAYGEAISHSYRFYSFGDAMLILK
ncbi:MAG: tRNA preQ1(34) S-adenosylmethionine ribosyltransferase-isomerase QueA [Candidatus Hydrothermarchaeales archaeon]